MLRRTHKPIYIQIVEEIKRRICSGELQPGMLLPKETEFAQEFNVARPTLRNAFAVLEQEGFIVRKKVAGTTIAPSALHNKHLRADIAVMAKVAHEDYSTYTDIFTESSNYVMDTIKQFTSRGCLLRFIPWFYEGKNFYSAEEIVLEKGINGFILLSPMYQKPLLDIIAANKIPHVALETHYNHPGVNTVMNDDEEAVYQAVADLYAHGHRRIGFCGSLLKLPELNTSTRRCMNGFIKACKSFKLELNEKWIVNWGEASNGNMDFNPKELFKRMLVVPGDRPTAVVLASEYILDSFTLAVEELGIRIPESLSVTCCLLHKPVLLRNGRKLSGYMADGQKITNLTTESMLDWLGDPLYTPRCVKVPSLAIQGETIIYRPTDAMIHH